MVCHHEDRAPAAPVAPAYHPGEVPEDYDLVCSSRPAELGDYNWDVDRDRYVHAGRVDFSSAEQSRTILVQVSGGRAKALFPARLGPTHWTMLDGASVNPGGIRARLGNGATLTIAPDSGSIAIRMPRPRPKPPLLLYSGRCTMITTVGSRAW